MPSGEIVLVVSIPDCGISLKILSLDPVVFDVPVPVFSTVVVFVKSFVTVDTDSIVSFSVSVKLFVLVDDIFSVCSLVSTKLFVVNSFSVLSVMLFDIVLILVVEFSAPNLAYLFSLCSVSSDFITSFSVVSVFFEYLSELVKLLVLVLSILFSAFSSLCLSLNSSK